MNVIVGRRQQGKTELLIKMSAAGKGTIVAPTEVQVKYIKTLAKQMELDIPEPISWNTFITKSRGRHDAYLLDEISVVLSNMNIMVATLDDSSIMYMGIKD